MQNINKGSIGEPSGNFYSYYDPNRSPEDNMKISCGGCQVSGCSCTSFVVKDRNNAQFCENCEHSRSKHG